MLPPRTYQRQGTAVAISYQLSVISYQLSAISYQLSVISYQLSAISYQPLTDRRVLITDCFIIFALSLCILIFAF